jgi:hypothetical protein
MNSFYTVLEILDYSAHGRKIKFTTRKNVPYRITIQHNYKQNDIHKSEKNGNHGINFLVVQKLINNYKQIHN